MEKERHMMEDIEQNGHLDLQRMYKKLENDQYSFSEQGAGINIRF